MRLIDAVAILERLTRIRRMQLPALIDDDPDYSYVLIPDLPDDSWPFHQPDPTQREKEHKSLPPSSTTRLANGLLVVTDDSSGIGFDTQNGCISGANISNMLGLRILRRYFHPDAVRERENERKTHPENYWQHLKPIDRTRLVDWSRCGYCWETTWCVVYHNDSTPRHEDEIICEECFEEASV